MRSRVVSALRVTLVSTVGVALALGLLGGGLEVAPRVGLAAQIATPPPRRPPVLPPIVPTTATEEEALWSYLDRVTPLWGNDWPAVIQLLDRYRLRFPENPLAIEKLYAAHIEAGRSLALRGEPDGARRHYQQALELDPNRGEAGELLEELKASP